MRKEHSPRGAPDGSTLRTYLEGADLVNGGGGRGGCVRGVRPVPMSALVVVQEVELGSFRLLIPHRGRRLVCRVRWGARWKLSPIVGAVCDAHVMQDSACRSGRFGGEDVIAAAGDLACEGRSRPAAAAARDGAGV